MGEVRERVERALDRVLEYASIVQRANCCVGEVLRSLSAQVLSLPRGLLDQPAEVPLRKRVEPPGFLQRFIGSGFEAARAVVGSGGIEVYSDSGARGRLYVPFARVSLFDVVWLSLVVEDWEAVAGAVRDEGVREAVERLASAAEVVRAVLREGEPLGPCPCPRWQGPSGRIRELIVRAAEALAEEGAAAQPYLWDWSIELFEMHNLVRVPWSPRALHPAREVEVPGWLAGMVESDLGIKPPLRLEGVRATVGDVELYVSGLRRAGGEGAVIAKPIFSGKTSPWGILLAAYLMEDEDWERLTAEQRRLLGEAEEACSRLRAAAALCKLLA